MTLLQELHATIRKMQNKLYGAEIVVNAEEWEVAKLCKQLDKIKQVKASMYDMYDVRHCMSNSAPSKDLQMCSRGIHILFLLFA